MTNILNLNVPGREGEMLEVFGFGLLENGKQYTMEDAEVAQYEAITGQKWPEGGTLTIPTETPEPTVVPNVDTPVETDDKDPAAGVTSTEGGEK